MLQKYYVLKTKVKNFFRRLIKKTKRFILKLRKRKFKKIKFKELKRYFKILTLRSSKHKKILKRDKMYNKNFLEDLYLILDQMHVSNGSKYYEKVGVKIAIVADEFLYDSWKDTADFIYITPDTYKDVVHEVDFLLIASAWRGLKNEWRLMGTEGSENNLVIHEVIDFYKKENKKVVFYSKEDPPNYEHFLPIAKKCDIIFTSCVEKVEDYKRDCKNDRVYVMEFCINPMFHNPIGMQNKNKREGVFFAGSWMIKYPDRIKSMEIMLDGVLAAKKPLIIADRNFSLNNITYFFPEKYYSYLCKEIPHDYLQKVHKLYNWAININSITDSKTMFANRVYELQANGVLMLSNYSIGVAEKFDEIFFIKTQEDVKKALSKYNSEELYEHQLAGIRRVMSDETSFDRLKTLLQVMDIKFELPKRKVLVVADELSDSLLNDFNAQSYLDKEIISSNELTEEIYSRYELIARWNAQSHYGKFYLEDMINAFKYTNCDYVTKDCYFHENQLLEGTEHDYISRIRNLYATIIWRESFDYSAFLNLSRLAEINNGYSVDHCNYYEN